MSKLSQVTSDLPLVLIGCGKMGGAMLQGWLKAGLSPNAIHVVDPYIDNARQMVPDLPENAFTASVADLPAGLTPGFVVLAVKPQMMDQALEPFAGLDCSQTVFMSIAAGKTICYFEKHLGKTKAIVIKR